MRVPVDVDPWYRGQSLHEQPGQPLLLLPYGGQALLHDESHSGPQASQAHCIGGAALVLVGEEVGLVLIFGVTAGAAILQRLKLGFSSWAHVESSGSLGSEKTLVTGESQQVDVHR